MARTFDDDWIAFPHPIGVLDRLTSVLLGRRLPEVCTSTIVPGEVVAFDYVGDECDSFAWGRVVTVYPSTVFPNPDVGPRPGLVFATTIEVGLIRRHPVPDNGEPLTAEEQYATARLQMADMQAIVQAICEYAGEDIPVLIGLYTPVGPDGGVVGGAWTATLGAV